MISLTDYLIDLNKILQKSIQSITFEEIVSLVFHAGKQMLFDNDWYVYYQDFEQDVEQQNNKLWPRLSIVKNDYSKRIDIYSIKTFEKSRHLFTLLLRLLYIENYKKQYVYRSSQYHKILNHVIVTAKRLAPDQFGPGVTHYEINIKNISLKQLFDLLGEYITYYIGIYTDDNKIEYQLGRAILNQLV